AIGYAANYELGAPFPMTCEGILEYRNGIYTLNLNLDQRDPTTDNRICNSATVAEESRTKYALKYTLKEKAISQILKICSLEKTCRIVGYMNGLSHDVYFWVKINSVSALRSR